MTDRGAMCWLFGFAASQYGDALRNSANHLYQDLRHNPVRDPIISSPSIERTEISSLVNSFAELLDQSSDAGCMTREQANELKLQIDRMEELAESERFGIMSLHYFMNTATQEKIQDVLGLGTKV